MNTNFDFEESKSFVKESTSYGQQQTTETMYMVFEKHKQPPPTTTVRVFFSRRILKYFKECTMNNVCLKFVFNKNGELINRNTET